MAMDILDLTAMDLMGPDKSEMKKKGAEKQLSASQVQQEKKPQDNPQEQMSDGTSDSIPALLSEGEVVLPADVTAILGNGSNEAGARKIENLIGLLRDMYKQTPSDESPKIQPEEFSKLILQALGGQSE